MKNDEKKRYVALDCMRGIAAIAVVVFHFQEVFARQKGIHHTYLAVDFFFALSGLVIVKSYTDRLRSGLTLPRFLIARGIRLLPVVWAGTICGAAWHVALYGIRPSMLLFVPFNLFLLPAWWSASALFPLNLVMWSVHAEFVVNAAFAGGWFRFSARLWLIACILSGAALMIAASVSGTFDAGFATGQYLFGVWRALVSFSIGAYFASAGVPKAHHGLSCLPVFVALALVLLVPVPQSLRFFYDVISIFVVLPTILWLGSWLEVPERWTKPAELMGDLSYPIYAIHFPVLGLMLPGIVRFAPHHTGTLIVLGTVFVLAWIVERFYDKPVRMWLSGYAKAKPSALPVVA